MPRSGGPHKYIAKDGATSWWQRVRLTDPLTGQSRQVRVTRRTKRELDLAVAQVRADAAAGGRLLRAAGGPTLAELAATWLERQIAPRYRPTTYALYEACLRRHVLPELGALPVARLTPDALDGFYAKKLKAGASTHVLLQCHLRLRAILSYALRLDLVAYNPTDRVKPPPHTTARFSAWTEDETRRFLAVANESRYGPIWLVIVTCALRRGEALGLRWCDIDTAAGVLHVRQAISEAVSGTRRIDGPKTPSSTRTVPVPGFVLTALDEWHRHQEARAAVALEHGRTWPHPELCFTSDVGTPIYGGNLYHDYRRLVLRAGLTHIRVHDQRHSLATQAREAGATLEGISGILGHKDSTITARVYVQTTPRMVNEAAKLYQDRLFPPPSEDACAHGVHMSPATAPIDDRPPEENKGRA